LDRAEEVFKTIQYAGECTTRYLIQSCPILRELKGEDRKRVKGYTEDKV
jgi:hypothetical protein